MSDIKGPGRHGAPKYQESEEHARAGYETLDAQAGATYRAGAMILGLMFVVAALLVPAYRLLVRQEAQGQPAPRSVLATEEAERPAKAVPKLVTSEPAVLAEHRAKEEEFLASWGWVEKDRGIARMPVSEALRLVGERGALPFFPAAAATPGPTAPAAGARP
jgi:hypothetical protein